MAGTLTQLDTLIPPSQEPVGLGDLKTYLHASDGEDILIQNMLMASRLEVEEKCSRAFLTQTLQAFYFITVFENDIAQTDYRGQMEIELPRSPTQAILDVSVENTPNVFTSIATDSYGSMLQTPTLIYLYAPAFGGITYPWWIETNLRPRIRVQYVAGYPSIASVPATYKELILEVAAYHYYYREASDLPPQMAATIQTKKVWTL